jgi:NAD(P)H-dependent flavin oxidoreductase YrpB (nitropropane dioxygenase family)
VAATEADAHPLYVEQLIAARAEDTVYPQAFSTNWPNAPHRVLRSCVAAAEAFDGEVVGETPDLAGVHERVRRFDCLAVTRATTERSSHRAAPPRCKRTVQGATPSR